MNTAELYIYDGLTTDEDKLITVYTGSVIDEFSVVANGAMTFRFKSYSYREEGWEAEVKQVDNYTPQAPTISFQVCSDDIVINANNKDATIYYTTDGSDPEVPSKDPLSTGTLYEGPFHVNQGVTVKAIAVVDGIATPSAVASLTYTQNDVTPTPGKPTITRTGNTVTMTPAPLIGDINETYEVWYKTSEDGIYEKYTNPIEWNTPNTTFYAITKPVSCSDKISAEETLLFDKVQVPDPTVTFTVTNENTGVGTVQIDCPEGYVLSYTTNGSDPTTTGGTTNSVTLTNVAPGTTVKAIAYKVTDGALDPNYRPSNIVTLLCLPGGEGESGVYGSVVILDDREDHSWSYYSDGDQPIRSLNPVDVKITYYGNGTNTVSTSNDANPGNTFSASTFVNGNPTVQVSYNETGNTFIYLKTLERADGTTSNDPTGNCAYTTIPNPFSKRPVYGNDNTTKWRGFYGWRVKAVHGGSIQNYAVGSTINAETEVTFVPDGEYGMEVELEALWARAYVVATGGNNSNTAITNTSVGYERNFVVLAQNQTYRWGGNTNPRISSLDRAATISRYYPDGTLGNANATVRGSDNITLQADTKFEYMAFSNMTNNNNDRTLSGAGHDLVIGRGVTGDVSIIQGLSASSTTSYKFRVESGTYRTLRFMGSYGLTSGKMTSILGSDYDRATKTNTLLRVTYDIVLSETGTVGSTNAVGTEAAHCTVKSGNFDLGVYGGNYQFYFSANSGTIYASRTLIIEGGIFSDVAGGLDSETTSIDHDKFTLRIKGGTIKGAVFGAAQYANAWGNRRFVITGGDFQGWIAGGANGTREDRGTLTGISYVYVGGNANVSGNNTVMNRAVGGNVFGAGCGYSTTSSSGQVTGGTNVVIADNAVIQRGVYGGGSFGYTTATANVYILGGTVNCEAGGVSGTTYTADIKGGVFGGACQNQGGITNIFMKDGTVVGSVYGGSNYTGTVAGLASVAMSGGTVQNVYGGGLGASTAMSSGTNVEISAGTINNNVYGGGEEGTVSNGNTHVNVSGGTMKDVFGAGKGGTTTAQVSGQTYVNVTGGSVANVYGGGEAGDVNADASSGSSNATVSFTLYGNHNIYNMGGNQRAHLTISNGNTTLQTIEWPRQGNNSTTTTGTVSVPMGVAITVTYSYTGTAPTNNRFTAVYDNETLLNVQQQPNNNTSYSFTIPAPAVEHELASTVTIGGATVSGDVFGGGKLGKTAGNTQVNIESGNVRGNVYGGAYGESGSVFVAGMHTVNIMGGRVFCNVYGGSRNANDALAFENYDQNETATNSVVNISAGQVDQQVYAAGYYGKTFGSVYAFIGKNAILNAPHSAPSFGDDNETKYKAGNLRLEHNVWAGGDWGVFTSGSFGAPTVSGYSDIYVDGDGYNTETTNVSAPTYMNIAGNLFGCGTSCDAGAQGRAIMVRNYGSALSSGNKNENFPEPYTEATRSLYSIQRADVLVLDNAHINFLGQAKVYSLEATEKYAINSFDKTVRIVGGSSLFMNAPTSQIKDWWNASCSNVYATGNDGSIYNAQGNLVGTYTPVAYNAVTGTPNKIRVNGGNYIEIYHDKMINATTGGYGMLNGFAYMMVSTDSGDNTCAYARPKQCDVTPIADNLDNPNDGGWVSYDVEKNTMDIEGNTVDDGSSDQMPYENHVNSTKQGEQYFRIWRAGGKFSMRQAVVNITANGQNTFDFVDVSVKLPAWKTENSYFKFQTDGEGANLNTTIDYGADVMMFNSALTATDTWIHFDEQFQTQTPGSLQTALDNIRNNPNVNFGLVAMPGTAMSGDNLIVCNESDAFLASVTGTAPNYQTVNKFTCDDFEKNPEVTLRFTYSNLISTNMTWEPMYITLVQMDENGKVIDIVKISITINIATTIDREFVTQTYAIMNGTGSPNDEYVAKVVLPTFDIYDPLAEHLSQFKLESVTFEPESGNDAEQGSWISRGGTYNINHFAMEISAANNEDNSDGWNGTSTGFKDSKTNANANGLLLGETGGREPFAFDFRLTYKGDITYIDSEHNNKPRLGMLTFTITYDNVKVQTGMDPETGEPIYQSQTKTLVIKVDVIRRGKGNVFYLDGQNGSNANSALYPDKAALSLSTIFNRCGYLPGDIIYIVNEVDVNKELEWSGTKYNGAIIYRYPGGHPLSITQLKDPDGNPLYLTPEGDTTMVADGNTAIMIEGKIVSNAENEAYEGALINVKEKGNLVIRDITLDGHMSDHTSPYSTTDNPLTDEGVESESPMITIASGGTLTLTNGTMLQENNSSANGGAVAVNDGGTLMMNADASIMNNVTSGDGGAVYMAGTMIVSDEVQLVDNLKGTVANNVFLAGTDKVIQIGTTVEDDFGPLTSDACIGVTKGLNGDGGDGFTKVVYVENSDDIAWLDVPFNDTPNSIIYHDGQKYQLLQYNNPQYLYWIGTWVTLQDHVPTTEEGGWNYPADITNVTNFDIYTEYQLAWIISLVNGENGQPTNTFAGKTVTIHEDIDMNESIWVPIGTKNTHFMGTFEGNGHVISGIHSILVNDNAAMFGVTEGATIQNMEAVVYFDGNSINKGTFIGTMNGGTLSNVGAAGELIGKVNTINMGGLVGLAIGTTQTNKPIIHSGFSMNTLTAELASTVVGGLVGSLGDEVVVVDEETGQTTTTNYYADLYNSYANVTLRTNNAATKVGGLVGINNNGCTVANCYVVNPINSAAVFAYTNNGTVEYCYAADGTNTTALFVDGTHTTTAPVGYGTYNAVKGRKELDYMYGDNVVTAQTSDTTYIRSKLIYGDYRIKEWTGLLSTLNQWVKANPKGLTEPAPWFRPTSADINGDLPLLGFYKNNSLSTAVYTKFENDYNYLHYGAFDATDNGLDNLLTLNAGKSAYMFLYGKATKVVGETGSNKLFINEDAVLIQDPIASSKDGEPQYKTINATVGVTFDNSCRNAYDYYFNKLNYDWHMMATPLSDASLGAVYKDEVDHGWDSDIDIQSMTDGYFPNGLPNVLNQTPKWDFYNYYEPEYHWINLKRNKNNHYHIDDPVAGVHERIKYNEADQATGKFTPGKGYMMAVEKDSYMSSNGTLNNDNVTIKLTAKAPTETEYNRGWNLVGNPYMAYLDLQALYNAQLNPNISEAYVYDADLKVYTPFVQNASSNPTIIQRYVHAHQAFFVKYMRGEGDPDNMDLVFNPEMATATEGTYFRDDDDQVNYPLVNLFAENAVGNRDLAVIEFHRPELGGATKMNGLRNANFQIFARMNDNNYGLLFTPEGTERVPVWFTTEEDGVFTLSWNTLHGNFTSLRLIDNLTGVNYDMLANDSYTFEAKTSDYASRFYITYTCTDIDEYLDGDDSFAFFDGSEWIINGKGNLEVVDVLGRVLFAERLYNDQNRINLNGYAKGVYLIRISDNKNTRVQKIVVR